MANNGTAAVAVVCPCGQRLFTGNGAGGGAGAVRGAITCFACQKRVAYSIQGGRAYTKYIG